MRTRPLQSLREADIDTSIRDIEQRLGLLDVKLEDWLVWPAFRFLAAMSLTDLRATSGPAPPWPRTSRVGLAVRDSVRLLRARRVRFVAASSSSNRTEIEDGLHKDIFLDDVLRSARDYLKIEDADHSAFMAGSKRALIKSDLSSSVFTLPANIMGRVRRPRSAVVAADELWERVRQEPTLHLGRDHLHRTLVNFYWLKRAYERFFTRTRPEFLLLVCSYRNHALQAAAKSLGVEVIELQHGTCTRHHPGYSWPSEAREHKSQMPIPDRILLYGDYWRAELSKEGFWEEELRVVGSPRVDTYRDANLERFARPTVVVTTQAVDTERLISFLKEFVTNSSDEVDVILKLHPAEFSKRIYEQAFEGSTNVRILLAYENPSTFELLARARLHVSISSTCHFEALALGTPTAIVPLETHDVVLDLHRAGEAHLLESPRDLSLLVRTARPLTGRRGEPYFKPNALENIVAELGL